MSENTLLWKTGDEEIFTRIRLTETSSGVQMAIVQKEAIDHQWPTVGRIELQTTTNDLEALISTLSTFVKTVKAKPHVK